MHFTEFIRPYITELLNEELPIYFYWDRLIHIDQPYVVYQTEDLDLPDKLDVTYSRLLNNAVKVYDYSLMNLAYNEFEFKPLMPKLDSTYSELDKEIDVLFYGLVTPRRRLIIDQLNMNVCIKENLTLDEMKYLIPRSKWILSIGSSSNIHNDLLRTALALDLGGNIMLESTQETWYDDFLKQNFLTRIQFI
jgi:hypothetical protein